MATGKSPSFESFDILFQSEAVGKAPKVLNKIKRKPPLTKEQLQLKQEMAEARRKVSSMFYWNFHLLYQYNK